MNEYYRHIKAEVKSNRFFLLIAGTFFLYLLYRIIVIFYPQPNAGGVEINIIYFIQRILDGQPFYTDPEKAPYAIAQYSPLYYYFTAGIVKLFSVSPDDLLKIYHINRGVSLLLNLFYLYIVFIIASKVFSVSAKRSFYVVVFAFIFLEITSYCRPDSLNHLFFMLSLYFFLRWVKSTDEGEEEVKFILLASAIAGVALFSKQTSIILPVIFGSWSFMQKKFKRLFLASIIYVAVIIAMLLLVYFIAGDLNLFYKNAVTGINNGIGLNWFRTVIFPDYYYGFGLLFVLAAILIFFLGVKQKSNLLRFSLFLFLSLFVLLNVIALKFGSNPGYFTEWWTLLFILTAYYWPVIQEKIKVVDTRIPSAVIATCLVVKVALLAKPVNEMFVIKPYLVAMKQYNIEKEFANNILSRMSTSEKYSVFCNYYTTDYYMSSLLFRHAVMPQMDIVMLASYPNKEYDYTEFKRSLKSGRYKWMLMRANRKEKQFFENKLDNYQLVETMAGFNLYEFKP